MFYNLFARPGRYAGDVARRKRLASQRLLVVYQRVCDRFFSVLDSSVRQWEKQPLHRRKWQLLAVFIGLLLLSSLSVYITYTGHFLTRINHKNHEQQFRRK